MKCHYFSLPKVIIEDLKNVTYSNINKTTTDVIDVKENGLHDTKLSEQLFD